MLAFASTRSMSHADASAPNDGSALLVPGTVATSRSRLRRQAEPTNRTECSGGCPRTAGIIRARRVRCGRRPRVSSRSDPSVSEMAAGRALVTARGQIPVTATRRGSAPPRSSSVRQQCRGVAGRDRRAGRGGVMSRVSGERHAASASRWPGRSKAMLGAEAGAQRLGVNTRYVNGSQRHPHDLPTYHWGLAGCHHHRHGGGDDQTVAPCTGATRTST
jgi:hypothetical protein